MRVKSLPPVFYQTNKTSTKQRLEFSLAFVIQLQPSKQSSDLEFPSNSSIL
jgi:hypothetical protein